MIRVVLTATNVQFGTDLGDEFFLEVFNGLDLSVAGVIDFAQTSLLSDLELFALQGDSVVLATLSFDAIGVGISSLDFVQDIVGGSNFSALTLDNVGTGSVTVNDVAVIPIPGAALLMLTGLFGIGVASRKRKI